MSPRTALRVASASASASVVATVATVATVTFCAASARAQTAPNEYAPVYTQPPNAPPPVYPFAQPTADPPPEEYGYPYRPRNAHFTAEMMLGPRYLNLYGDPITGVDMHAGIGVEWPRVTLLATVQSFLGATRFGLPTRQVGGGIQIMFPIGRLRLGIEPAMSSLRIGRVTETQPFDVLTTSVAGHVGVDVLHTGTVALAVNVRPTIDWIPFDSESGNIYGLAGQLELRVRAPRDGDPR
jgi:hypothetical protein